MVYQLPNPIDVATKLGDATAIMIIDYGQDVNSIWMCRFPGGEVKHILSDDIRIYGNPMYGNGWDIKIPEDWEKYGTCPKDLSWKKNHIKVSEGE